MYHESAILKAVEERWASLPHGEVVRKEVIPGHVEFLFAWEASRLQVIVCVAITSKGAMRETVQIMDSQDQSLLASETKMHGAHFVDLYKIRKDVRNGAGKETTVRVAVEEALRTLQANPLRSAARLRRKEWQPIGEVNMPICIVQGGAPGLGKRA